MIRLKSNNPIKHRSLRQLYGVQSSEIGKVDASVEMISVAKITVTITNIHEFTDGVIGDIWHEVHNVPLRGLSGLYNGWIAEKHKGEVLLDVISNTPTPDPSPDPTTPDISTIVEGITIDLLKNSKRIVIHTTVDIDEVIVGNDVYYKSPPLG